MAIFVTLLFAGAFALAENRTQRLVSISNDRNPSFTHIELETAADGKVKLVRWNGPKPKEFKPEELGAFQVVEAQSGVDAMLIKGNIGTEGGELTIKFVYNGITRSYRECKVNLKRKDGEWRAYNIDTQAPVTEARTLTRAIGIEKIQGICP